MEDFKDLLTKLWSSMTVLLVPAGVGLICISPEIVFFMGGDEFLSSITSLRILGLALISSIFGGLVMGCMNIVMHREKDNLKATSISSVINVGLNVFFIPWFSIAGAAITTFISEAFVFLFCFKRIPQKDTLINFSPVRQSIRDSLIGSAFIIVITIIFNVVIPHPLIRLFVIIATSVLLYAAILLIMRNDILNDIKGMIKKKLNQ